MSGTGRSGGGGAGGGGPGERGFKERFKNFTGLFVSGREEGAEAGGRRSSASIPALHLGQDKLRVLVGYPPLELTTSWPVSTWRARKRTWPCA